jgi:hypothetical protein
MLFSHAVIPHHHHFDSVIEHSQETNHSDEKSQHCHAFNDLYITNAASSDNNVLVNDNLILIIFNTDLNLLVSYSNEKPDAYQKYVIPADDYYFNNSPTRGSPVFI